MKSWRSRISVGLAMGAAVIAVPLVATTATASAAPPPGDGWVVAGGDHYNSKAECEAAEIDTAREDGYHEVWCDDSTYVMTVYFR
ncbi:hypothetical protein [Amycolatopsis minnesotensis]|uniref:Secreted protein n=1 Tax=Amycolatopsis minnesotensis TaxID=337894 RepID=A0ABN2QF92_9PSEU